jgi:hypothetical protein
VTRHHLCSSISAAWSCAELAVPAGRRPDLYVEEVDRLLAQRIGERAWALSTAGRHEDMMRVTADTVDLPVLLAHMWDVVALAMTPREVSYAA